MLNHMGETHRDGIPGSNINIYNRSINFTQGEANADLILHYSKEYVTYNNICIELIRYYDILKGQISNWKNAYDISPSW